MRLATMLLASPFLFVFVLVTSAGCGSKVIAGTGGNGGSSSTDSGGTSTGTGSNDVFTACSGPGQCVLVNNGCCDACGEADLSTKTAVNAAQADAFFKSICPEPTPCPGCLGQPNPNLFAYCDNGTCRAADVSTHAVSACTADSDCMLRYGTGCCEGCGGGSADGLIAVSSKGDLFALVCGDDVACPACAPMYPPDAAAICNADHCEVVLAGFGGGK